MNPFFQLEIPRRHTTCMECGERLSAGDELYSLLLEQEELKSAYRREDFCLSCWEKLKESKLKAAHICSYWHSSIEKKKIEVKNQRKERALALLKNFYLSSEPVAIPISEEESFVLALLLLRAKKIALRRQLQREGHAYGLYEILGEDLFLTIKNIPLSSLQIEALQKSLADKLM